MKTYFMIWAWGLALVQGALAGEAGIVTVEQRTQSFTIILNGSVSDVTPLFGPVREAEWGEKHCNATITYRRSALTPEGNEEVVKLNAHWAEEQRIHWETAINETLAKGGIHD